MRCVAFPAHEIEINKCQGTWASARCMASRRLNVWYKNNSEKRIRGETFTSCLIKNTKSSVTLYVTKFSCHHFLYHHPYRHLDGWSAISENRFSDYKTLHYRVHILIFLWKGISWFFPHLQYFTFIFFST